MKKVILKKMKSKSAHTQQKVFPPTTWSGAVSGTVSRTYDNFFRIISRSVNGANAISQTYDNDGLLANAGSLAITRNASNGFIAGTTLGSATTTYTYNTYGEVDSYTAKYSATALFNTVYTRDVLGRITRKVETVQGVATTYDYQYDPAGRLTSVSKNGVATATYVYDNNGNRITATQSGVVTQGFYDLQDRLTSYGNSNYTYTANGELASKTLNGRTANYVYDVLGNLTSVIMSDGALIEYVIDGQNRRIGKKVNGSMVQGLIYESQLEPVAEFDGAGNVVSRFIYGEKANIPDYMIRSGVTYRIISDHLGSPRLVVDTATGVIAQRTDYDEFGNVILDTNPGFQPFGFAGGIYDQHTKLTRHGARDYDAETGRWTAKDPIRFKGGDTNLFGYVTNDPINEIDLDGLKKGCGPSPIAVHSPYGFKPCCEAHDDCYNGSCENRNKCDYDFCACMFKICKTDVGRWLKKGCMSQAKTYCGYVRGPAGACAHFLSCGKS